MDDRGLEVWRGGVPTWECDAMGHMNVGFYVAKCMEGLVTLAAAMGMPEAFTLQAAATLVVREHHIRFLREARPLAMLVMTGGVLEVGESEARLLFLLRHADGELAATFNARVAHATAADGRAFPWPERIRRGAEALAVEAPPKALPRGLTLDPVTSTASLERAEGLGLHRLATGAVRPLECDIFGRMRPDAVMFRLSDGAAHLFDRLGDSLRHRIGAAVVEYRLLYLDPPGVGRRLQIRSGFSGGDPRTRRMTHWMLDPDAGRPLAVAEALAVTLDLEARQLVELDPEAFAALRSQFIPGLTL